jgi:hypothetical protein
MSLSDLASLGSFVSGLAVLVSLLFVGFQLRQNAQAVRATASQAHSANYHSIVGPLSANAELARIWLNGLSHYEEQSNEDRARFILFTTGLFRFWEASRVQWRHGQLDKEHWQTVEETVRIFVSQPGIRSFWKVRGHSHSTEFQDWFESLPSSTSGLAEAYDWRKGPDGKAPATRN